MLRFFISFFVLVSLSPTIALSQESQIIEDFQQMTPGTINRSGWYIRDKHDLFDTIYSISQNGENKFLHADTPGPFVQIFKKQSWSVKHRPFLTWKWRVIKHPEGANSEKGPNDTAASIYVVFKKGLFSVRSIKYVWANQGSVGHIKQHKADYPQIIIRSGKENLGEWVMEQRDVAKDYRLFFGKEAGKAIAFGIVTESDSVKVKGAIADYDDFMAHKSALKITKEKAVAKPK